MVALGQLIDKRKSLTARECHWEVEQRGGRTVSIASTSWKTETELCGCGFPARDKNRNREFAFEFRRVSHAWFNSCERAMIRHNKHGSGSDDSDNETLTIDRQCCNQQQRRGGAIDKRYLTSGCFKVRVNFYTFSLKAFFVATQTCNM